MLVNGPKFFLSVTQTRHYEESVGIRTHSVYGNQVCFGDDVSPVYLQERTSFLESYIQITRWFLIRSLCRTCTFSSCFIKPEPDHVASWPVADYIRKKGMNIPGQKL